MDDYYTFVKSTRSVNIFANLSLKRDLFQDICSNELIKQINDRRQPLDYINKITTQEFGIEKRIICIDWAAYVADDLQLFPNTLFLAVKYMDTYLSYSINTEFDKIDIIILAGLVVASKLEEYSVDIASFHRYVNGTRYTLERFKEYLYGYEMEMLKVMNWNCNMCTACQMLPYLVIDNDTVLTRCIAQYFITLSLLDYYLNITQLEELLPTAMPTGSDAIAYVLENMVENAEVRQDAEKKKKKGPLLLKKQFLASDIASASLILARYINSCIHCKTLNVDILPNHMVNIMRKIYLCLKNVKHNNIYSVFLQDMFCSASEYVDKVKPCWEFET